MKTERCIRRVRLDAPAQRAFAWHARSEAFERLVPAWRDVERFAASAAPSKETEIRWRERRGLWRIPCVTRLRGLRPPSEFTEERVGGLFPPRIHVHRFEAEGATSCAYVEEVEFRVPRGFVGERLCAEMQRLLFYRHSVLRHDLRAHLAAPDRPMKVLVTGSRGLIGRHLIPYLAAGGHRTIRLARRADPSDSDALEWESADSEGWEGFDAVVHLAGANLAHRRWTRARKQTLRVSRVEFTRRLAERLAGLSRPPRALVCASAVGWYGAGRRAEAADEEAPAGDGFLAELARDWEAAAAPARLAGIRVAHLRFGMVLSPRGGALGKMLPAFQAGLGGPLGSGGQWMSWIAMDDALDAIHRAIWRGSLVGPVNAVAPFPVSQTSFAAALGRVLGRPARMRVPARLVDLAFGEMGRALLLEGVQAAPARLLEDGFAFRFPTLDAALRHLLGRYPKGTIS